MSDSSTNRPPVLLLGLYHEYVAPRRPSTRLELYSALETCKAEGVWPRGAALVLGACTGLGAFLGPAYRYTGATLPLTYGAGVLDELFARGVSVVELGKALAIVEAYMLDDLPPLAPELEAAGKGSAPTPPT